MFLHYSPAFFLGVKSDGIMITNKLNKDVEEGGYVTAISTCLAEYRSVFHMFPWVKVARA
jgi:hypothetical protein